MQIIDARLNFGGFAFRPNRPEFVVVHHAAARTCTVQDIDRWHKQRGWAGIGYHFFIRKNGRIYRGRHELHEGAHCPANNMNFRSLAICLEGDYATEQSVPSAQLASLQALTRDIQQRYSIPLNRVTRHLDHAATACPGGNFPWAEFIASLQGRPTTVPPALKNGRVILAARDVADALGATLEWDEPTQRLRITLNNRTAEFWVGRNTYNVQGG